jgi:hypothetical protein
MYFAKRNLEEPEMIFEDTEVFACQSETCNGWMRKEFSGANDSCPMCGSSLSAEIRELPKIETEYNAYR